MTAAPARWDRSVDRRFGVAEAIVVEVNDPEKEGRVKIRFPWFDENMISEWCRVCQLYAGSGYGALWTPEVEDEVLVAFIHGDMRQPIVLGGLYNGVDKPATHRAADRDEKLIRTKSGHQILFVDTDGEERIVIVDKSEKHRIEVNTDAASITITSNGGKLSLAAREVEIKADENLTISANTIAEKAVDALSVEAGQIEAKASGQMVLKGSTINLN